MMESFVGQSWFQIVGEIVLVFTTVTGTLPDRWVAKIPVLGKLWPIFNWLAGNVFNNVNHPKGMEAIKEVEFLLTQFEDTGNYTEDDYMEERY